MAKIKHMPLQIQGGDNEEQIQKTFDELIE